MEFWDHHWKGGGQKKNISLKTPNTVSPSLSTAEGGGQSGRNPAPHCQRTPWPPCPYKASSSLVIFYSQKLQNGHPHSFLKIRSVILKQTMDFQNHLNKQKAWKTSSMFPLENNSLELTYGQVPPGPMTPCCIMSSLTPVGIFTGTPEEGPAGPSPTTWFNHFSPVAFHFMPIPRIAHKYPWPQEGPFSNCWVSFQHLWDYLFFLYKKKRH